MSRMGPGIFSLTYLSARDKTRAAAFEASESTGKVPGKLERSKKTGQDLGETERMISAIECKKNERKRMRCGGARRGKVGLTAALRGSASNFFRRRAGQGFKGPAKTFLARAGPVRNKMGRPGPVRNKMGRPGPGRLKLTESINIREDFAAGQKIRCVPCCGMRLSRGICPRGPPRRHLFDAESVCAEFVFAMM